MLNNQTCFLSSLCPVYPRRSTQSVPKESFSHTLLLPPLQSEVHVLRLCEGICAAFEVTDIRW